jgi:FkbM family methyltransferase
MPSGSGSGGEAVRRHLKRIIRSLGYDVRRLESGRDLISFIHAQSISLVLDVGANTGQFATELREQGYSGRIVSFEPIGDVFKVLSKNSQQDGNWSVLNVALGSVPGDSVINVSEATVFSSLLPQTDDAVKANPAARLMRQETIRVVRLDDVFDYSGERTLLKVDTQGFEREILDGAVRSLQTIKGLQLELPIVHLYKGTWGIEDAVAYMNDRGFVLCQIKPVNFLWEDPVLEVDCLFRRRDMCGK